MVVQPQGPEQRQTKAPPYKVESRLVAGLSSDVRAVPTGKLLRGWHPPDKGQTDAVRVANTMGPPSNRTKNMLGQ